MLSKIKANMPLFVFGVSLLVFLIVAFLLRKQLYCVLQEPANQNAFTMLVFLVPVVSGFLGSVLIPGMKMILRAFGSGAAVGLAVVVVLILFWPPLPREQCFTPTPTATPCLITLEIQLAGSEASAEAILQVGEKVYRATTAGADRFTFQVPCDYAGQQAEVVVTAEGYPPVVKGIRVVEDPLPGPIVVGPPPTLTPMPTPTLTRIPTATPTTTPIPTPKEFITYPVGDAPSALAFDGESIWVANGDDDTVMKLSRDGEILGTFLVGKRPDGLAHDGQNIWVLNDQSRNVMKLAPDGKLLGTYEDVGSYPQAIAFYDGSIWVVSQTYYGDGSVFRLALDGSRRGIYPVGDTANALAFDGESVWVTNSGEGTVSRLTLDGELVGTYAVGDTPTAVAFDGENIWVAADRLVRLTSAGEVSGLYDLDDKPTDFLFDGTDLWVASSWGHSVTRVTREGEVVDTYAVGGWASDLTFDGENTWVTNMTENVVVKLQVAR